MSKAFIIIDMNEKYEKTSAEVMAELEAMALDYLSYFGEYEFDVQIISKGQRVRDLKFIVKGQSINGSEVKDIFTPDGPVTTKTSVSPRGAFQAAVPICDKWLAKPKASDVGKQ